VAEFLGLAILIPVWQQNGGLQSHVGPLVPLQRPAWEHGTLAIRPERIQIRTNKPEQNGVRARVTEVIHHGTHLDVFVEPKPLRLRVMSGTRVEPGEKIWLELPGEHLEVLRD
jgi:ABC-type sugar transport system ATPase subunit